MEELLWTYLHHQMVLVLLVLLPLLVLLLLVLLPLVLLPLVLLPLVLPVHQEVLHNLRLGQLCL
jgi:hypothetical protein